MTHFKIMAVCMVGLIFMIWFTPFINQVINQQRYSEGYNVEGCAKKDGQMFAVSEGIFGASSKAVCLLPNGEIFNIYVSSAR